MAVTSSAAPTRHISPRVTSYRGAISFLYGLQKSGMKFGLRKIRLLLRLLGNPERQFRSIHVAGSNGKGSTAAIMASILSSAGYRTGLYTSPHLISFEERIRINGRNIQQKEVTRLAARIQRFVEKRAITFFEACTAVAFRYFADQDVDIVVVETGLGGRLDATNVVRPMATVITTISREHTEILGNSIGSIAYEKAGILKRNIPCITGVTSRSAFEVIRRKAKTVSAPLRRAGSVKVRVRERSIHGTVFDAETLGQSWEKLRLDLPGEHQVSNAKNALLTLTELVRTGQLDIPSHAVRTGLAEVRRRSGLSSRLSIVSERPRILCDVAHNPAAVKVLKHELERLGIRRVHLVFGVMKDKDYRSMIAALRTMTTRVFAVSPSTERSRDVSSLVKEFRCFGVPVTPLPSVAEGIAAARRSAGITGTVLVTGSHFVVGEGLAFLEGKKYLTINQ